MTTFDRVVLEGFIHLSTVARWAGGGCPTADMEVERRSCAFDMTTANLAFARLLEKRHGCC